MENPVGPQSSPRSTSCLQTEPAGGSLDRKLIVRDFVRIGRPLAPSNLPYHLSVSLTERNSRVVRFLEVIESYIV